MPTATVAPTSSSDSIRGTQPARRAAARPPAPPGPRWSRTAATRRGQPVRGGGDHPPGDVQPVACRRRGPPAARGRGPPAASGRSRRSARRARWPPGRRPGRAGSPAAARRGRRRRPGRRRAARLRRAQATAAGSTSAACTSMPGHRVASAAPRAPQPQQRSTTTPPGRRERHGASHQELGPPARHEDARVDRHPQPAELHPAEDVLQRQAGHPPLDQAASSAGDAAASASSRASSSANTQPARAQPEDDGRRRGTGHGAGDATGPGGDARRRPRLGDDRTSAAGARVVPRPRRRPGMVRWWNGVGLVRRRHPGRARCRRPVLAGPRRRRVPSGRRRAPAAGVPGPRSRTPLVLGLAVLALVVTVVVRW